jgi:transcriptional regulator with XRE-family HTH domain
MFSDMLERDRRRRGFTVGQVAWRLGVSPQEYRELEAGTSLSTFDTWDRICKLYGWSQSFVGKNAS